MSEIVSPRGLRPTLFTLPLTGGEEWTRGAFGTAVYSVPLGERRRGVTLFWCSCCTHGWQIKGTSFFRFLVRNQNCYVKHRDYRAETRTAATGAQTNWAKTKTALWALPSLACTPLLTPLLPPSLSFTLCWQMVNQCVCSTFSLSDWGTLSEVAPLLFSPLSCFSPPCPSPTSSFCLFLCFES